MTNVLFAISLLANVALAGGLIYTTTEMHKLDDQRESLAISNDQYKRKLNESSSTSESAPEGTETLSNSEANSLESSASTTEEADGSGIRLYRNIYHFDNFSGTIAKGEGLSQMSEHFTKSPVTVTDSSGTYSADLYTNHDGTAQIMQGSKELYSGTYEINPDTVQAATDSQSIADYKELSNIIRNNPDRKQQMQALQSSEFSSVDVDSVRTSLINEAMKDNIRDEEYNALAQRILKQCELSAGQGEQ
ncbi:hypothetical protein [Enterococcus mundtii]|uniref:hypothetical protein n=1 Tax=Enterococcus mundtii TaxID=53346 RepID=UPI001CF4838C|nr:hypothetical protein [Enterococcus mundtii]MCA6775474.1 hypothetical protein [Enterococcus mundtii]